MSTRLTDAFAEAFDGVRRVIENLPPLNPMTKSVTVSFQALSSSLEFFTFRSLVLSARRKYRSCVDLLEYAFFLYLGVGTSLSNHAFLSPSI